jgi:hypothetical protein
MEAKSKSSSRRFPVTVTHIPVSRCQICRRTVAYRPGSLNEVLTEHYRRAHPEALGLVVPVTVRGDLALISLFPRASSAQEALPRPDPGKAESRSVVGLCCGPARDPPLWAGTR